MRAQNQDEMPALQERRSDPPLCVDLDGTLLKSDLLVESLLLMLKRQPWTLFLLPWWLLRGKAHLKHEIARRVEVDVSLLPYHPQVLPWVREEHQAGRQVVLATASHERYAQAIAAHLGCFDAVEASRPGRNLEGRHKAAALVARYGAQGFDCAGNSRIWVITHRGQMHDVRWSLRYAIAIAGWRVWP